MRGSAVFRTGIAPGGALAGPWVRDPLWTRARAVPSLDLRFADNKSLVDAVTGAQLVTFTRASSGTFVGSNGLIQTAATNEPRFDHNPTTGESLGLLVEEARTNVLLNSATLSTQSVTVAAAANTLSFYGTGTVTLTGVSTAGPLVGTGANNRVSLTFTPTVGVLILTVSGSVTNAQLEAGAFATSYIPTTTATVTRAADVASITGSNFSSWYRQDEGTFLGAGKSNDPSNNVPFLMTVDDGTLANEIAMARRVGSLLATGSMFTLGVSQADMFSSAWNTGAEGALALGLSLNNCAISFNGQSPVVDTSATLPAVTTFRLGRRSNTFNTWNGTIRRLTFWPARLGNEVLQRITQP